MTAGLHRSKPSPAAELAAFHVGWGLLAAALLAWPAGPVGWRILAASLAYVVALPVYAARRRHSDWHDRWRFLLPLGALQIVPDWYLANRLGVLVFPDTGSPAVGTVPLFMAGLWMAPLFLVLWVGDEIRVRAGGSAAAALAAGAASSVLFSAAEATLWAVPIWYATGVPQTWHVAHYLLWPELCLGLSAWVAWRLCGRAAWPTRLAGAAAVMLIYQGNLTLSHALLG